MMKESNNFGLLKVYNDQDSLLRSSLTSFLIDEAYVENSHDRSSMVSSANPTISSNNIE